MTLKPFDHNYAAIVAFVAGVVHVHGVGTAFAATGALHEPIALAAHLAATFEYGGNAGQILRDADDARKRGFTAEAQTVREAVDLWYSAVVRRENGSAGLRDHDVQRATFGLSRLGDSIPSELQNRIRIDHRLWTNRAGDAIYKAIAGWSRVDPVTNANIDGVMGLPEERRRFLKDDALPKLEAALLALRESVDKLIVNAYEQGVRDGSDLLSGLASGNVSVGEFNNKTTRGA